MPAPEIGGGAILVSFASGVWDIAQLVLRTAIATMLAPLYQAENRHVAFAHMMRYLLRVQAVMRAWRPANATHLRGLRSCVESTSLCRHSITARSKPALKQSGYADLPRSRRTLSDASARLMREAAVRQKGRG